MQRLCRQVPGARHRGIQLVPYVAKQTVYKTGKLVSSQQQQQQQAGSVALPSRTQQGLQEEAASEPQYETANREAWEWMSWWDSIPSRYKLVVATSVSFMLSNAVSAQLTRVDSTLNAVLVAGPSSTCMQP